MKYGWESVCEGDQVIEWEDTLTLPEAPEKWPNGDDWQVSVDRLSCTRRGKEINKGYGDWFHKIMFLKSGKIEQDWNRVWRAAPGDPEGTYQLSVTISGKKFHQELKFIKTAL